MLTFLFIIACFIALYFLLFGKSPKRCHSTLDLSGKTVIVTGGAIGIGYEISKDLAKRGAHVIMGCINVSVAEQVSEEITKLSGNDNISVIPLDLASFDSVRRFANQVCEREKEIYALVNNAGLTLFKHVKTEDNLDTVMQVNFFSPFLLTLLLLDRLVVGEPSRVVFVTSMAHKLSGSMDSELLQGNVFKAFKQYGNSKLCQIYFCQFMARNFKQNVTFNSVHPGTVNTSFFQNFPFTSLAQFLARVFGKTPEDGAQTVIYAVVDRTLKDVSGKYLEDCSVSSPSRFAMDKEMEIKVIKAAETITGTFI